MADGVLGEIVARKRRDVAARLAGVSMEDLRARAEPTQRSLREALAGPGARFIMEVKRASPSEGAIRADADPAEVARGYADVADAVSVLVDAPYFGGSYADLAAVRAVFDGPILAKDFVVDPRQVPEARLHGADAVLVMLSVLDDVTARDVMAEAVRLGMDALVEAHTAQEVRRAVELGAAIIGINNRDLRTLQVDLATTEALAPLVPGERLVVAESGICSRADVERLASHADAFLVGSSLMRAADPAEAARALVFGRVKVCGLTRAEDVRAAEQAGASHLGLIFVPGTPRAVTAEEAAPLVAGADRPAVGVFRNEGVAQVAATARQLGLSAVQLHGEEDRSYMKALRNMLPQDVEIWAATSVGTIIPEREGADRILYDNGGGGSGATFEWSRLTGRDDLSSAILAGGLTPDNAADAAKVGAWALDVGSGVEASPGRKDPTKLRAFFEALRPPSRREAKASATMRAEAPASAATTGVAA